MNESIVPGKLEATSQLDILQQQRIQLDMFNAQLNNQQLHLVIVRQGIEALRDISTLLKEEDAPQHDKIARALLQNLNNVFVPPELIAKKTEVSPK